jgi:hypothetical protein
MRIKVVIAASVMAFCYREQPGRSQQRLYIESNRIITPHLWARDQENTNPSRSR